MQKTSKHKLAQLVVSGCKKYGIDTVVVSPGSRNAPLIIAFNNDNDIKLLSVVDERCAAFFALGIAQQQRKPVAVLCTSGSALLNYYPAIAEAFYSDIPLVVLSADRPSHLIDVGDGQTIRQKNVFANHSLYNANLGESNDREEIEKAISESVLKSGPVHINIPFDEPLYQFEEVEEKLEILPKPIVKQKISEKELLNFASIWNQSSKKIVLVGQHFPNDDLQKYLEVLSKDSSVLVLVENTANVSHSEFINSIDKLIFPFAEDEAEQFKPNILLTLGGLIVSKKIKQHLRKFQPEHHWHIDSKRAYDTFHCLTKHFNVNATAFFGHFLPLIQPKKSNYQSFWIHKKQLRCRQHELFIKDAHFSDIKVFDRLLSSIPKNSQLQLSNSSTIRYAQLFDIDNSIKVFCNRGTSGIDGSTSTAVGAAYSSDRDTVFITGDISFFYDSNALWNEYIPKTFRIILINNGGGGIFRFIPGPKESDSLPYFETPHQLTAEHLCKMYEINYYTASNEIQLKEQLLDFYKTSSKPKLLEIFTPRTLNDRILKKYFQFLKQV